MKKLVSFILCTAFCLSALNIAFAAEDSGVTEALAKVKERIDTTEYDEFKSSYHKNEDGNVSYQFEWSKSSDEYKSLYVTYADGIITSYSIYGDYDDGETGIFSLSEADAAKIASDFIKRINPDISEKIKIVPENNYSMYSDYYSMSLYRVENGIPVLGETGYLSISKSSREVTDFNIEYTKGIDFKTTDGTISAEDAKKAYKELIPPVLRYDFKYDYRRADVSAYLEYASEGTGYGINAYDGSKYELFYGGDRFYADNMAEKSADDAGGFGGFTPAELEEAERIAGLLSEEQARKIIKENKIIAMPEGFTQEYASLNRDFYDKNEYQYEFGFKDSKDGYINVSLDAKNGEILSFYKYSDSYDESKYDRKAEEKTAAAAFLALAGEKSKEFRLLDNDSKGYLSYVRVYDGIDVVGDGAYFHFDSKDNISGYSLSYTKNVEFPSKNGVISADAALESAFGSVGFELMYSVNYKEKTAQPVYVIGKNGETCGFTMNPFTGHLTDYSGEDIKEAEKIAYSDIDGHYGKDMFNTLAEYGIGFSGGELKPDEPVTQAEYFVLLSKALWDDADIDTVYRRFITKGTVSKEERADDSVLTRENAAIFMIREIGAEEYAKYEDMFIQPFDDVTENKGYIAILKAKGIMNGDGSGNFYPKKSVTRGEALIMLYNCLTKN